MVKKEKKRDGNRKAKLKRKLVRFKKRKPPGSSKNFQGKIDTLSYAFLMIYFSSK